MHHHISMKVKLNKRKKKNDYTKTKKGSRLVEKSRKLVITPFKFVVHIVYTNDIFVSSEKRGIDGMPNGAYAAHCGVIDQPISYIFLPHGCGVDSVAHEISHCTWHIFEVLGATHENEFMAYMNGYMSGETVKFLKGDKRFKLVTRISKTRQS